MVDLSGKQIDNYRLLGLLGQGSFDAVYLAENMYRKNQVAVKILQMQFSVEEFHEFVNEARIFRLRHPNIVSVLDFGIERASNIPFIVMDYEPNGTLRKRHPKGTRVPLEKIVVYSRQIAAGLQYAHEENLVHRDLKPENLLFGAKDEVLLSDFGIAVISQSGRTAQAALNSAGMEDDKRGDRNPAKAEAARRLAHLQQGTFWIGTERQLSKRRHYNLVYLHARRKIFPAFADIASTVREVWSWGEVAPVEKITRRLSQQWPPDLVEATIWKVVADAAAQGHLLADLEQFMLSNLLPLALLPPDAAPVLPVPLPDTLLLVPAKDVTVGQGGKGNRLECGRQLRKESREKRHKMATPKMHMSPRLTSLEHLLLSGNTTALEAFWLEVTAHGAPLIEAIEGDDTHVLVTFLWRGQGETHNAVIFVGPSSWESPADSLMTHLLDTDLWYKTYQVRADLRTTYLFSPNDPLTPIQYQDFWTRLVPDPLNTHHFLYPKNEEDPEARDLVMSILELPQAPPQPWILPRPSVAQGRVEMYRLRSQILDNERCIWIYTPPNYARSGESYSLLLLFDGVEYLHLAPTPTILDNLLQEGEIPPLVTVLIDALGQIRNQELPCHQPFVDFLTQELLPWVYERYYVTRDRARTTIAGSSYGGLAAAFAGLRASEYFGNVLSQSGEFRWDTDPETNIPQEWLTQQFVASPHVPVRFYLEVGLQEQGRLAATVPSNRHLRDVLRLKGYEVHYTEFNGGHEFLCWRGSLADGLVALVGHQKKKSEQ